MNRFNSINDTAENGKRAWRGHGRTAVFWLLAALALNLLGNGRHSLWDRDEARFATATRQMLASGDWVVPHLNDVNRYDKPVLIYWLMAAPMRLLGENEFAARMPAAVAGAGTVALVYLLGVAMGMGEAGASLAALMAMTSALLLVIAKAATTDSVLTLTIMAMLLLVWRQRQEGFTWGRHVALFAILGASILVKGPPGPLVVGLTVLADGIWRWFNNIYMYENGDAARPFGWRARLVRWISAIHYARWAVAIAVVLAVALPWAWLAWQRTGGEYFRVAIGRHVIERSVKSLEGHRGPIVYYLPVLLLGMFPWTAVVLMGLRHGWRCRRTAPVRFLWCWILPALAVFSLASTKLPHYVAPLLPALALMSGLWWSARAEADETAGRGWWAAGAVLMVLTVLAGVAAVMRSWMKILNDRPPMAPAIAIGPAIAISIILIAGGLAGAWLWWRGRAGTAVRTWSGMMLLAIVVLMTWLLPAMEAIRPSKAAIRWTRRATAPGTHLMAADYKEPSLLFYWGGLIEMPGDKHPIDVYLRLKEGNQPAALIITRQHWEKWRTKSYPALAALPLSVHDCGWSFIFQRGKWTDLLVVRNQAAMRESKIQ